MLIKVHNLTKLYQKTRGLLSVSFEVNKGELIAILGHNGAGKSTLLKILSGQIIADSGDVWIDNHNLKDRLALVREIGFVSEAPNLFDFFSVEYNFQLFARLFQISFLRIEEILKEFNLLPFRYTKIQALSKGLKQRVSIGRSLLANPSILFFDEPISGLDFEMTKEIYRLLKEFHVLEKTILFTSHRPEDIRTLATRILLLHEGALIFDGSPQEYFQSKIHQELYC